VQIAFTRSSEKKLIVNHFTTPIAADQPRPAAWDWREVAFDDLVALKEKLGTIDEAIRPHVFYAVASLSARTDL